MQNPFLFWWRWLMASAAGVAGFGLSMVLLPEWTQGFFNLLIFGALAGNPTFGAEAVAYITFVSAVLGAVMWGWGVLMLLVLRGPFRRREPEAWWMLVISLVAWFVPDTLYSLASGFWPNAVFNSVFALVFALPLWATRGLFLGTAAAPGGGRPSSPHP